MKEPFEGHHGRSSEWTGEKPFPGVGECSRLEEVGDLHFHASAYSSALDYYRQLLSERMLTRLPLEQALGILRKAIGAALNLGRLDQVDALLSRAHALLGDASDLPPSELRRHAALFQGRRASLLVQRARYRDALDTAKHAFAILALSDEHVEVANLQVTMGACHQRLGRLDKAEEFFTDSLATFRRVGDELGTAALYSNLALIHKNACRWDRALALLDKAVELASRHGATHLLSRLYLNQGIVLTKTSRFGEAEAVLQKSLRLARSLGDRLRQAKVCIAFARLEILTGRLARAEELVHEGKLLAERGRYLREATIADEYLGDILLLRGEPEKALFNYGLGLEKARGMGTVNDLEGELLRRTAEAQRRCGRLPDAIAAAHAAVAVCEQCGEVYELGFCHLTLGLIYAAQGDWKQTDSHFAEAIHTFRQQNLVRETAQAVLDYRAVRLESAGQRELLVLRREFLDVQEQGAAALSDRLLCLVLAGLAEVQIRLGQHDDALLTVFELERHAAGLEEDDLTTAARELRARIEQGLLAGAAEAEDHLQVLTGIPGLFDWTDASIPRNLGSVLRAGMERVQADSGFIAMETGEEQPVRIVERQGITENLCAQLTTWFAARASGDGGVPSLHSRLTGTSDLVLAVPGLTGCADSCVLMPIALHGRRFGLLFLGKKRGRTGDRAFARTDIDFLATYLGFLALFLFEKGRGALLAGEPARSAVEGLEHFENVITRNPKMLDVLALARKVAPSDLTVLLNGETGTGKGLLAYAIHGLSRRADRRFLAINCAAIPETLLEGELFGHMKGSFTGADQDKKGLLEEAAGGTVFLDEIGKMPLAMQAKLLHFMDTKVVRPVGSAQERRVDVRIVCASKSDLQNLAHAGHFLEDLYFRLLDFPLVIPPLRDRREDVELLAHHFVERFAAEAGLETPMISPAVLDALQAHDWPGNVRELEKVVRRALVLMQGDRVLRTEHLPADIAPVGDDHGDAAVIPLRESIAALECREMARALEVSGGNKSQAARLLKISYPSLLKKIRLYGLEPRS
ncbi:MAG: sigma 54-interacting transcriptional regulator [Candidatus Krumholzibacteriia bacterium]